ncbi:MAG: 16S rRNA (cytidine(1402)-2'-O)-methyltransferase [Vicinamibacteria bacterium]
MAGRLFVVATPIGNLEDLSPRAARTLREVALIACEDTRRTGALLASIGARTPMTSFFEHNERAKSARVVAALREGRDVALVSDAGTPAISDPGYRLVREARALGLPVIPVPGPSAAIAAVSASGLPSDRFLFVGFLPARAKARREAIAELRGGRATLLLYESPLRVSACLADLEELLGDREAFLCREATKLHEEYVSGRLSQLREELSARGSVKGEIVLVVAGAAQDPGPAAPTEPLEAFFDRLLAQGLTRREAARQTARAYGLTARDVYQRTLKR